MLHLQVILKVKPTASEIPFLCANCLYMHGDNQVQLGNIAEVRETTGANATSDRLRAIFISAGTSVAITLYLIKL